MIRLPRQSFILFVLIAGLLSPAIAGSKEDAHDLLTHSFQQANLWTQGPVKLVAQVRMPRPNGQDITLQYTVSWAGPNKWRAEWSAPGLQQVTILNNGGLSHFSNQPPMVRSLEFEAAVAALDAANPAGPYSFPPLDYEKAKIDVSRKKINGADAKCLAFSQPLVTLCIDPSNGHLLTADGDLGTFEYSDYVAVGSNFYPQSVKVSYVKTPMEDAKITVTRGDKFDDSLFTPLEKSTSIDFPSCADAEKNFTAPHLNKPVAPKMPEAAKKAKKYGMVWVLANVSKDGLVQKTTVLGGEPELTGAATDAVQQYKYSPYMRCGQAAEFETVVVVPFAPPQKLPEEPSPSSR